jgi:hypothetical protein
MKYVKWSAFFEPEATEGYTPEVIIRTRGGWAEGGFSITTFDIVGYTSDDADLSGLEDYKVQEITQAEALAIAQAINPKCFLREDGKIDSPLSLIGAANGNS